MYFLSLPLALVIVPTYSLNADASFCLRTSYPFILAGISESPADKLLLLKSYKNKVSFCHSVGGVELIVVKLRLFSACIYSRIFDFRAILVYCNPFILPPPMFRISDKDLLTDINPLWDITLRQPYILQH